jgi:hypothetical protein
MGAAEDLADLCAYDGAKAELAAGRVSWCPPIMPSG